MGKKIIKTIFIILLNITIIFTITSCERSAIVASRNVSRAADEFEINRRIVFYNGITDKYMLEIQGWCSLGIGIGKLTVTCKVGEGEFKKHYLGLSDNVTFFAEQLDSANVSTFHHRVIWKPQQIIPNIEIQTDREELRESVPKLR